MQVVPYSEITQQVSFSGTKRIGGISLPSYSGFHFATKTPPAMSDEAYKEAIVEQAKKDQAEGVLGAHSAGYRTLCKSYISCVSPDRQKIISEGLQTIVKDNKPHRKPMNLIDYLFGKIEYYKDRGEVLSANFHDKNGEEVARYSNGGWTFSTTKAEVARENEFIAIYNAAWSEAAKASENPAPSAGGGMNISV